MLVTLSYPDVGSDQRSWGTGPSPCLIFRALGTFCEAHRNPTSPRPGGDPHRNPTDEAAHSGTLVVRVKGTENSRSAASMRVSWAVGAFSR
jgi:hypothetical protein